MDEQILSMLIQRPNIRIVSRDVTLPTGEIVRAFFAVIDVNGAFEVRFLGTKKIAADTAAEHVPVALLQDARSLNACESAEPALNETESPYLSLDFLVNQLARAPSFA